MVLQDLLCWQISELPFDRKRYQFFFIHVISYCKKNVSEGS